MQESSWQNDMKEAFGFLDFQGGGDSGNGEQSVLPKVCRVEFDLEGVKEESFPRRGGVMPPTTARFVEISDEFASTQSRWESSRLGTEGGFDDLPSSVPLPLKEGDGELEFREVVIDKNGVARQAGADSQEGEFIKRFKKRAEESLFVLMRGVLGYTFITDHFHKEICNFIQEVPAFRKLLLMPRGHVKTGIVSGGLPIHILIQPKESNIYFPGLEGSECRILLAGETERMAKKNLRVLKSVFEENKVFRAFWPQRCWLDGKMKKEWSSESIIIPRDNEWPDPTIKAVGVGGAITGARPNVLIEDDLVSFKAMNSEVVMQEAIDWHITARALLDKYEVESDMQSLQFVVGTRWAVFDLYSYILDNDLSIEVNEDKFHKIISDGKILWPEKYNKQDVEDLRLEYGSMFYLLYLNSAADPSLTDFDMSLVRDFVLKEGKVVFEEESRDSWLRERADRLDGTGVVKQPKKLERGRALRIEDILEMRKAGMGVRLRG